MKRYGVFLIIFWLLSFYAQSPFAENNWERFLDDFYIRDISLDDDNVYCATRENGIIVFNKTTEEYVQYTQSDGLLNNETRAIAVDKNRVIWVWTLSGIQSFDGSTWETYTVDYIPPNYEGTIFMGIFVDTHNTKWFWDGGYLKGAISFDGLDWHTYTSQDSTLLSDSVFAIKEDNGGRLWFGCAFGVTVFDGINWSLYEDELRDKHVFIRSICCMKNNDVWLGGDYGGVTVYDGQFWKTYDIVQLLGLSTEGDQASNRFYNQVYSITETPDGMVWLQTGMGMVEYDGFEWNKFINNIDIWSLNEIVTDYYDDVVWDPTSNGLLKYDPYHTNRINENTIMPKEIEGLYVYPNPSNNGANIQFSISTSGVTFLSIYNILGQTVRNQPLGILDTGVYTFSWNGRNDTGESVESGVYVIKLIHNNWYVCNKMLMLK